MQAREVQARAIYVHIYTSTEQAGRQAEDEEREEEEEEEEARAMSALSRPSWTRLGRKNRTSSSWFWQSKCSSSSMNTARSCSRNSNTRGTATLEEQQQQQQQQRSCSRNSNTRGTAATTATVRVLRFRALLTGVKVRMSRWSLDACISSVPLSSFVVIKEEFQGVADWVTCSCFGFRVRGLGVYVAVWLTCSCFGILSMIF